MALKKAKWIIVSLIILFYAFIYVATSKVVPISAFCAKTMNIDSLLKANRSYVYGSSCWDSGIQITVKDTAINWNLFADTVCMYLHMDGVDHSRVVVSREVMPDTLVDRKCP